MANQQFCLYSANDAAALTPVFSEWSNCQAEFGLSDYLQSAFWHHAVATLLCRDSGGFWVTMREGGQLKLVLPLQPAKMTVAKGLSFQYLRVPEHSHIPLFDLCFAADLEANSLLALLDWLKKQDETNAAFVRISQLAESARFFHLLQQLPPEQITQTSTKMSALIKLHADYEQSVGHIKGKFMRNVRRQQRKAEAQGELIYTEHKGSAAALAVYESFLTTEAAGWKGKENTAIKQHTDLTAFYRQLLSSETSEYCPQINTLNLNGKAIAAQLGIRCGDQLSLLKIGYDEAYADCGPGNIILNHCIEAGVGNRLQRIRFVTDPPWATNWLSDREQVYDVTLFARDLKGKLLKKASI